MYFASNMMSELKWKLNCEKEKKNANASYFIFRVFHVCKPFIGVKVFIFNFEPCDACVQSIAFEHFLIDSRSSANMYPYHTSCFGRWRRERCSIDF